MYTFMEKYNVKTAKEAIQKVNNGWVNLRLRQIEYGVH